ncbi:MAG TPA: DUF4203 domain-containing protein [Ktedonobacterales bacterium]
MDWAVLLTALALIIVGLAFLFAGYRLFRLLIPIWGFFVGFDVAVAVGRAILHMNPLATLTGWILALVVGVLFAALAYGYYYLSVVLLGASVGFLAGEAVAAALFPSVGAGALIAGIIGAIIVAVVVISLDLPKALIVVLTALGGASAIVVGGLLALGRVSLATLQTSAISGATPIVRSSMWLTLLTLLLALIGMAVQAGRLRAYPYSHAYARRPRTVPTWPRYTRTSRMSSAGYDDTTQRMPPATPV